MNKLVTILAVAGAVSTLHFTGIAEKTAKAITGDCAGATCSSSKQLTSVDASTCPSKAKELTAADGATCPSQAKQLTSADASTCSSSKELTSAEGAKCSSEKELTSAEGATCSKSKELTSAEGSTCATKSKELTSAEADCDTACDKSKELTSAKADCDSACDESKELTSAEGECTESCDKEKALTAAEGECDASKKLTQVSLKFAEAQCEVSSANVTKKLTSLDGITKAETCGESHFSTLSIDAEKTPMEKLLVAFKKAGLNVESQKVAYDVEGMSCGACSSKVSKQLTSLEGVQANEVCHESKKAVVTFDPTKTCSKTVAKAITDAGYKASIQVAAAPEAQEAPATTEEAVN